jgi:hypothetical protein
MAFLDPMNLEFDDGDYPSTAMGTEAFAVTEVKEWRKGIPSN